MVFGRLSVEILPEQLNAAMGAGVGLGDFIHAIRRAAGDQVRHE